VPGEVQHRRAPDVVEQRGVAVEVAGEEDALAQARLGRLDGGEAADLQDRVDDRGAREDQVGARVLDARDLRAVVRLQRREPRDQLGQRVALDDEALHAELRHALRPLHRGREVADGAADADEPVAGLRQPRRVGELGLDMLAQGLQLLLGRRALAEAEALGHPHRAQRPGLQLARVPRGHADQLHRAAAEVEHRAVGQGGGVDRGQVAHPRLLLLAQDADRERGAREEVVRVGRVADRRCRDRVDLGDPERLAEVREDLGGRQPAGDAFG
jgi:hypothetical protein